MQLCYKDFRGMNRNCDTIQSMVAWAKDRETFTIDQLVEAFPGVSSIKIRAFEYIIAPKKNQYLEEVLHEQWHENMNALTSQYDNLLGYEKKMKNITDDIDAHLKEFEDLKFITASYQKRYNKSIVILTLETFMDAPKVESHIQQNHVMQEALELLCRTQTFDIDDFEYIRTHFRSGYWFPNMAEHFYRTLCQYQNNTGWQAFEKSFDRKPFIVEKKRVYERAEFITPEGNKMRCTGWNRKGDIKFVIELAADKQNRLSFSNESFKAFLKQNKIQWR